MTAPDRPHRMGYREALRWIVANDDTEWLFDTCAGDTPIPSVTAIFAADIFGRSTEAVTADLQKLSTAKGSLI